ncbi:MAG: AAA family ATPase [Campylobacterota bacterium]|nr:AAA family ATPase [Campylobacterota bacterium]
MADNTKYNFYGEIRVSKRRLAELIITKIFKENRNLLYKDLKRMIDFKASNNQEVIYDESDYLEWSKNLDKNSSKKRYFNPLLNNNEKIYISTQWNIDSIQPLIQFANLKFNFKIEVLNENDIMNKSKETSNLGTMKKTINIKNIILYGAPGVGKTHNTQKLISLIENGVDEKEIFRTIEENIQNDGVQASQVLKNIQNRVRFITFHQSYSYEDFIEGFKPTEDGGVKRQDGIFKEIVENAKDDRENNYYLVIDEINRGNISKVFGELITLIEEDKRDSYEVTLPYSKEKFNVPSNLYIIATMNSTDKSIATIDIALRRRFTFLKMKPNENLVKNDEARSLMIRLNEFIKSSLSEDYKLGHSYFMKIDSQEDLGFVKEYKIKPLLEEYFYADDENHKQVLEILNYKIDTQED